MLIVLNQLFVALLQRRFKRCFLAVEVLQVVKLVVDILSHPVKRRESVVGIGFLQCVKVLHLVVVQIAVGVACLQ